ncbi:MAG: flagellar M-ring protein FliF [Oscillospiraceae bacterium]|nr:flagellar M-ring protein FliF [Oscillospiraceae bacterium]
MDTTKLKGLWEKVKDFFKNMSTKVRIILGVALAVLVVAIAAFALWAGNRPYEALYHDLNATEASEVLSYLQENGFTDYRLVNGDTIEVRADQRNIMLTRLAQAGYPRSGNLFGTYFEHVGTMSTSSERAQTYLITVMEGLATTIRTFPGVQDATVWINQGEERTYVLEDSKTKASASVKVTMRDGYTLTSDQADAIRLLIANAVGGMEMENISITDGIGNNFSGDTSASISDAASLKAQQEEYQSNKIRTEVMQALSLIYGPENVRVAVNVQVEVNRRYIDSTRYERPEGSYENGGLIGRETGLWYITRDGLTPVGGVVGTESNSDLSTYVEDLEGAVGDEDTAGQSTERENKIDEIREQVEVLAPTIADVSIAVTINENANSAANLDEERLINHVAMAAGIGGEEGEAARRVSVLLAPLYTEPAAPVDSLFTQEMVPYLIIAAAALLLIVIFLVILLSVRRKRKRKQQEEEQRILEEQLGMGGMGGITPEDVEAVVAAAPPAGGADIMEVNTEKSMELRKTIRQFVQNNPEVAAQMLKVWLKGGEDDNG